METGKKVLVYGGTGSQGGAVVRALIANGHTPYVLTRTPSKVTEMYGAAAVPVQGDLADADSLVRASQGMDAVALMIPFGVPDPSQIPHYARQAIEAAKQGGVGVIVYNTSGTVMAERVGNPVYDTRQDIIDVLAASGVPYFTVEPTAYLENLLGPWTRPNIAARDALTYPTTADTALGWVATADVGALIAMACTRPDLASRRLPISGERNLTGTELAAAFSEGLGRSITFEELPLPAFGALLDQMFGPGTGDAGIAGYQFQRDHADRLAMWHDMRPTLADFPIRMTSVQEWAAQHAPAFAPQPAPNEAPGA